MVARFSAMFSSIGGFLDGLAPFLPRRRLIRTAISVGKSVKFRALVGRVGIEPTTPGLKVRCSAS